MKKSTINESDYMKRSMAFSLAAFCIVAGFFLGFFYKSFDDKPDSKEVRQYQETSSELNQVIQKPQSDPVLTNLLNRVKVNPKDSEGWALLGHHYFDSNQPAKAIGAYNKNLEIIPNNPNILTDLGVMYRRTGNPDQAIESFKKAIKIQSDHQQAHFNMGIVLLYDKKDKAQAIRVWKDLLKFNPAAKTPNGQPLTQMIEAIQKSK